MNVIEYVLTTSRSEVEMGCGRDAAMHVLMSQCTSSTERDNRPIAVQPLHEKNFCNIPANKTK